MSQPYAVAKWLQGPVVIGTISQLGGVWKKKMAPKSIKSKYVTKKGDWKRKGPLDIDHITL